MNIVFQDPENAHAELIGAPLNDKGDHDLKAVELLKDFDLPTKHHYKVIAYTGSAWKNADQWETDEHNTISVDAFLDYKDALAFFIARCFQFLI